MAGLIVVGFKKDMYRASEVLNTLSDMNESWVVDLHDAVAVYRDYGGEVPRGPNHPQTTGRRPARGGPVRGALCPRPPARGPGGRARPGGPPARGDCPAPA